MSAVLPVLTAGIRAVLLDAAAEGRPDMTPADIDRLTRRLTAAVRAAPQETPSALSPREIEVITGLARGLTRAEIAECLGLKPATVATHLRKITRYPGCVHRAGAVATAYRAGWLAGLAPEPRGPVRLSRRRREVLAGMADGLTDQEIAVRLGIGEPTARTHARRMLRALDARTRAHAVALGFQHGLLGVGGEQR